MNSGKIVVGRVDGTGRDGTEIEGSIKVLEEHHQEEMTIEDRLSNQVSIRILI